MVLSEGSRLEKEGFVRGLSGTSVEEVVSLALFVPLCFAAFTQTSSLLWTGQREEQTGGRWRWRAVMGDVGLFSLLILIPLTLALTVAAEGQWLVHLVLAEAAVLVLGSPLWRRPSLSPALTGSGDATTAFLSVYRVSLLLSTAVAILAVDFPLFPRRLAKTEEFGVSPVSRDTAQQNTDPTPTVTTTHHQHSTITAAALRPVPSPTDDDHCSGGVHPGC